MPVYEYQCQACRHEFEHWQKISEPPVKTCPKCKKRRVERLISLSSFQLKGGGWYSDLYGSQKPGAAKTEAADSDSGKSESKAEAKDAKSESKSDAKNKSDPKTESKSEGKDAKGKASKKSTTKEKAT